MSPACNNCKKSPPEVTLKKCAKCSTTPYCSRDCQKADWKAHRKICGRQDSPGHSSSSTPAAGIASLSPPKGLDQPVAKPFTRLTNHTWLHDRSEKDVYRLLIDAYRMRAEDNYSFASLADVDSIYGGASDGLAGFRRFLDKVAASPYGLLPAWWNEEKRLECERLGMEPSQWSDLRCVIEKSDVVEHYGHPQFPMQLRMFAETVLGSGPGGSDGKAMRQMLTAMENGDLGGEASFMSVR